MVERSKQRDGTVAVKENAACVSSLWQAEGKRVKG